MFGLPDSDGFNIARLSFADNFGSPSTKRFIIKRD